MEAKTIKDGLNYIDCGIVDNNCNSNYIVYMRMIHRLLLNSEFREFRRNRFRVFVSITPKIKPCNIKTIHW